jgi:hypothetical protein
MIRVYVVTKTYDYADDGFDIIGVFSTVERAWEQIKKVAPTGDKIDVGIWKDLWYECDWGKFYEYYDVNEYEIDKLDEVKAKRGGLVV